MAETVQIHEIEHKKALPSAVYLGLGLETGLMINRKREVFIKMIVDSSGLPTKTMRAKNGRFIYEDYPRDLFQVFDDLVFSSAPIAASKLLGKKVPIRESLLGVGGKVLRSGRNIVLTSDLRGMPEIEELEARGFTIDFLTVPIARDMSTALTARMEVSRHIDMECNMVLGETGRVVVANRDYFTEYGGDVVDLADKYDADLHIIEDMREQTCSRAVNFIELPNGKVVMSANCPETKGKLIQSLGAENVLESNFDPGSYSFSQTAEVQGGDIPLYFHGGLRCMSNVVS